MSVGTLECIDLDGAWEDRAQALKWDLEDRRAFVLDHDYFWEVDPNETVMEREWHRIRLDVLEEVARAVRNGEEFDAYLLARPRAEALNSLLSSYEEAGGGIVLPSMISHYVARIDVPSILSDDMLKSLGWVMPENTPRPGEDGFD